MPVDLGPSCLPVPSAVETFLTCGSLWLSLPLESLPIWWKQSVTQSSNAFKTYDKALKNNLINYHGLIASCQAGKNNNNSEFYGAGGVCLHFSSTLQFLMHFALAEALWIGTHYHLCLQVSKRGTEKGRCCHTKVRGRTPWFKPDLLTSRLSAVPVFHTALGKGP